ncbi:Mediator of RNA polymerase II transcription subunit 18 [Ascosphaera aggregata]|nr:Mediator of RNA polymerase II transcription subunit 18 [Ascosphaera aggregata]
MHQHLLFAPVSASQHRDVLAQLTGIAAMQPVRVLERHLIFKPFRKPGFTTAIGTANTAHTAATSGGGSGGGNSSSNAATTATVTTAAGTTTLGGTQDYPSSSDAQRLNKILNGAMHYIRAVGQLREDEFPAAFSGDTRRDSNGRNPMSVSENGDIAGGAPLLNGDKSQPQPLQQHRHHPYHISNQEWEVRFEDTPVAGNKFPVTTRYTATASLPYGDPLPFLNSLGFKPARHLPPSFLEDGTLVPLDSSGSYVLQASITVADGGSAGNAAAPAAGGGVADPELIKLARERLLALKDRLKLLVPLEAIDRLALDTRAK